MKKLLAVSGGIDSMVMLDSFADDSDVLVVHFNHGTRPSADDDQYFVQGQAARYHKPFFTTKQILGPSATEETARTARYHYLEQLAREQHAEIYTAHHQDDLLESIAINLLRGTGWRGLAPLDRPHFHRPLLQLTKKDIYTYASQHQITFRQDPTNTEDHYLRNRLRPLIANLSPDTRQQLLGFYRSQKSHKTEINQLLAELLPPDRVYQRSWFAFPTISGDSPDPHPAASASDQTHKVQLHPDDLFAYELLRSALAQAGLSATRPQLQAFLHAIRTYAPGKKFNLPGDHLVTIHKTYFKL